MFRSVFVALACLACLACQARDSGSPVVIEASGLSMTQAEFERLVDGDARLRATLARPDGKAALGREFGKAFALEAEARRRKLDQSPEVQLKVRNYTMQLLGYQLLASLRAAYLKDEAALTRHYEAKRSAFEEPRVRTILVRVKGSAVAARPGTRELSEAEARAKAEALRAKLAGGADFTALAKEESDDTGSRDAGGDIGFVARGATDARFEELAYSLPVGAVSDVIRTEFGFQILRVEERRVRPLESVKEVLANELAHKDMEALSEKGYKLNDAFFGK